MYGHKFPALNDIGDWSFSTCFSFSAIGGSQKGGFQKGGFGGCSLDPQNQNEGTKKRKDGNEGTKRRNDATRKPEQGYIRQNHPLQTALLLPFSTNFESCWSGLKKYCDVRPEMITQIIRKQFFCVTDDHDDVCNWKINSQTLNVCNWAVHKKYLHRRSNYTK